MRNLRGSSERSYVAAPWGQIHVRQAGNPAHPSVLLLHQSPLSSATYESVLPALAAQGLHAVAVDTPGYGLSDPPPQPWSVLDYARGVWSAANALDLESCVLLGQHTGAVLAAEATRLDPQRVIGLVLQGLPLYDDSERVDRRENYAPPYDPAPDGSHLQAVWDRVHRLYPDLPMSAADRQMVEYLSVGPDYAPAYRAVFDHEVDTSGLRSTPVLLMHGERDLVAPMTPRVQARLPHASLRVLEGGTDFVASEAPEEFAGAIAAWVHKLTTGATKHSPADRRSAQENGARSWE